MKSSFSNSDIAFKAQVVNLSSLPSELIQLFPAICFGVELSCTL